jgi:hypothetical protein
MEESAAWGAVVATASDVVVLSLVLVVGCSAGVIAGVDGTELERTDAFPVDEECECVLCLGGAAVNATLLTERSLEGPGDAARSLATVSKSGGGSDKSSRDDDAKAIASAP